MITVWDDLDSYRYEQKHDELVNECTHGRTGEKEAGTIVHVYNC